MVPRLRKDLVATAADEQGVACVEVTDPASGTTFRFYDFEYALAQELNGQPLEAVVAWAHATYGIDLSAAALDLFVEKLAGLGFLEGSSSGAQPAILAPFSPSSSSHPFGDLPTTVAVDGASLESTALEVSTNRAVTPSGATPGAGRRSSTPVDAVAPQGLISGDPREYGLRDAGSGLWERPGGLGAASEEPSALLPKLEVLAGPLPPVAGEAGAELATPQIATLALEGRPGTGAAPARAVGARPSVTFPIATDMPNPNPPPASLSIPVRWPPPDLSALGPLGAPAPPTPRAPPRGSGARAAFGETAAGVDTPLASVADAIAASIAPGSSALDDSGPARASPSSEGDATAVADVGFSSLATAHLRRSEGTAGQLSPPPSSWASNLVRDVDRSGEPTSAGGRELDDRRPQQRPLEVVVIPPTIDPSVRVALDALSPSRIVTVPRRRSYGLPIVLLLVAAGSGAAWFLRAQQSPQSDEVPSAPASSAEAAPQVHVVSPQPTTFYRWFETAGAVTPGQDDTLTFRASGRIQEVMPPGTTFAAGETIGRLYGVAERELAVNKLRSRVSYYEQLRDSSRAEGAAGAAQQAEVKLSARRQELAAAQAALAELEIRPRASGIVAELLVSKGTMVKPGTSVFHVRSSGPRATFPFSGEEAAKARALGFCRLETVPGTGGGGGSVGGGPAEAAVRAIDCMIPAGVAGSAPESRLAVDLVAAPTVAPGTQVRLASARFDGVFPVPRSALAREGGVDHVWIVSGGGRFAERRTVEVADTVDDLGLVRHGIAVGDAVIVDPPVTLKGGAEINVAR